MIPSVVKLEKTDGIFLFQRLKFFFGFFEFFLRTQISPKARMQKTADFFGFCKPEIKVGNRKFSAFGNFVKDFTIYDRNSAES